MSHSDRLKRSPAAFRQLTGLTPAAFDRLLADLAPRYELAGQLPDATHVYLPAGGGGLLTATVRGLRHRGLTARVVAAQSSGCAPIVRYLQGEVEHNDCIMSDEEKAEFLTACVSRATSKLLVLDL